jgi:hypothetical protein
MAQNIGIFYKIQVGLIQIATRYVATWAYYIGNAIKLKRLLI